MTTNEKTLDQQLIDLKEKQAKELIKKERESTLKYTLKELTGLDFMVLIHSYAKKESTSIWLENNQWENKFDRTKINEYYTKLCTLFNPVCKPLTFASSKEIENFAPAKIDIDNSFTELCFSHTQTANIIFTFENDITVSFKLPVLSAFDKDIIHADYQELKPQNKIQRLGKKIYSITPDKCGKVHMYQSNFYHYCRNNEELQTFMNVIFEGK